MVTKVKLYDYRPIIGIISATLIFSVFVTFLLYYKYVTHPRNILPSATLEDDVQNFENPMFSIN